MIYLLLLFVFSVPSFAAKCIKDPDFNGTNNPQMNAPYFQYSMDDDETGPPTHWEYLSIKLTWTPYNGTEPEFEGYRIRRDDGEYYARLTDEAEPVLGPGVTSAIRTNVASLSRRYTIHLVFDGVDGSVWASAALECGQEVRYSYDMTVELSTSPSPVSEIYLDLDEFPYPRGRYRNDPYWDPWVHEIRRWRARGAPTPPPHPKHPNWYPEPGEAPPPNNNLNLDTELGDKDSFKGPVVSPGRSEFVYFEELPSLSHTDFNYLEVQYDEPLSLELPVAFPSKRGTPVEYVLRGELPEGVTYSPKEKTVSGTPKEHGEFKFYYRAIHEESLDVLKYAIVVSPPDYELEVQSSHSLIREDDQPIDVVLTVTMGIPAVADETIALEVISDKGKMKYKKGFSDGDLGVILQNAFIIIPKGQRVGMTQITLIPEDNEVLDSARAIGLRFTSPSGHQAEVYIDIFDDEIVQYAELLKDAQSGHSDLLDEYLGLSDGDREDREDVMVLTFAEEVEDQGYVVGRDIGVLVLPEALPKSSPVSYRLVGLPEGLVFDPATRVLSGSPTSTAEVSLVRYIVTDEHGRIGEMTFYINVESPTIDHDNEDHIALFELFNKAGKARSPRPELFSLSDNFPNPFNPATTIPYALPQAAHVELTVYNVAGQPVRTLVAEHQSAGRYAVEWDATGLSSGMYFYRLEAGDTFREVKKMLLLR